jgi:hypothetical protein
VVTPSDALNPWGVEIAVFVIIIKLLNILTREDDHETIQRRRVRWRGWDGLSEDGIAFFLRHDDHLIWPPPISKENADSQNSSPIKLLILKKCSFASSFVSRFARLVSSEIGVLLFYIAFIVG